MNLYKVYTASSEKAKVAQRAAEFGVTNTIRFFAGEFTGRPLKESTIRVWVKKYKKELVLRKQENRSICSSFSLRKEGIIAWRGGSARI